MRRCCRWALLEWLRVRRCSGHGPGGGTLLIYELLDARALRSSGLTAALPVYYAALAAFVLISLRLYLAANRASLRRGEEHLRAAPV